MNKDHQKLAEGASRGRVVCATLHDCEHGDELCIELDTGWILEVRGFQFDWMEISHGHTVYGSSGEIIHVSKSVRDESTI